MQPDMMRRLQQLQQQAAQLGQLARDLAAATPQQAEGQDRTGWVRITLDASGLPTEIRIRDGWQQRLEPERLGAAVLEANTDAVQRAMQTWTERLDDGNWWRHRADADEAVDNDPEPVIANPDDLPHGQERESTDLAEQALATLQAAQQQRADLPPSADGTDDGRHVTVRLEAGGMAECLIEPRWAAQRDGATISAALSTAVRRAAVKRSAESAPSAEIDTLVGDALATLAALTIPTSTGGDR